MSYSKELELTDQERLAECDPRELLVKIMERDGLRVIDLFKRIDDDASWSVTRDEFKIGIRVRKGGRWWWWWWWGGGVNSRGEPIGSASPTQTMNPCLYVRPMRMLYLLNAVCLA